jgi:hypothetical protein
MLILPMRFEAFHHDAEYRIGIPCPRSNGKTVAGPPDAASAVKSSQQHG